MGDDNNININELISSIEFFEEGYPIVYRKEEHLKDFIPECDYDILFVMVDGSTIINQKNKYGNIRVKIGAIFEKLFEINPDQTRDILIVPIGKNLNEFILIINLFQEINEYFKFSNKKPKKFTGENISKFFEMKKIIQAQGIFEYMFDEELKFKIVNGDVDFSYDDFYTGHTRKNTVIEIEDRNRYNYGYDDLSKTYFFTIPLKEMIKVYEENYKNIFSLNIRSGLAEAGKNFQGSLKEDFIKTISKNPEHFYIKNNGITILVSNDIEINQSEEKLKVNLETPKIINGAQTISFLALLYYESDPLLNMSKVYLPVRIFSSNDKSIGEEVTISLNRQNPVSSLELAYFSDEVKKIKEYLNENNINLIRRGEMKNNSLLLEDFLKYYFAVILFNPGKARNSARNTLAKAIQLKENESDEFSNYDYLIKELFLINNDLEDKCESKIYNNFVSIYSNISKYNNKNFSIGVKEKIKSAELSEETRKNIEAFASYGFYCFISIYSLMCFNIIEVSDDELLRFNDDKLYDLDESVLEKNTIFSKINLYDSKDVLEKIINHYIHKSEISINKELLTTSEQYKKEVKIFRKKKGGVYEFNKESLIVKIIGLNN